MRWLLPGKVKEFQGEWYCLHRKGMIRFATYAEWYVCHIRAFWMCTRIIRSWRKCGLRDVANIILLIDEMFTSYSFKHIARQSWIWSVIRVALLWLSDPTDRPDCIPTRSEIRGAKKRCFIMGSLHKQIFRWGKGIVFLCNDSIVSFITNPFLWGLIIV